MGAEQETIAFVDTTTLAGAGRVLHVKEPHEGGKHADEFYSRYPDTPQEDWLSFVKLLTIVSLFDKVVWEASSETYENQLVENFDGLVSCEPWLYRYFPAFKSVKADLITDVYLNGNNSIWNESIKQACLLVDNIGKNEINSILSTIRLPKWVKDPNHYDRSTLTELASNDKISIDGVKPELALFLARGLYYQSLAVIRDYTGYVPHSFRSLLLVRPDVLRRLPVVLYHQQVEPRDQVAELLESVNRVVAESAGQWISPEYSEQRAFAIGYGFIKKYRQPQEAWQAALEFRSSMAGSDARTEFKILSKLAKEENYPLLNLQLKKIDKLLSDYTIHKYGASNRGKATFGVSIIGDMAKKLEYIFDALPDRLKININKLLFYPIGKPTGLQVLFSNYFSLE